MASVFSCSQMTAFHDARTESPSTRWPRATRSRQELPRHSMPTGTSANRPTSRPHKCSRLCSTIPFARPAADVIRIVIRGAQGSAAQGSATRGPEDIASRAAEQAAASSYGNVHPSELGVHLTSRLHDRRPLSSVRAFLM
jgi:hypothetical protein